MCKGEKAILICGYQYGYGELGMSPKIPPMTVLKFEVHFIDFGFKEKRKDEMTNAERINLSMTLKNNGNESFKEKQYQKS